MKFLLAIVVLVVTYAEELEDTAAFPSGERPLLDQLAKEIEATDLVKGGYSGEFRRLAGVTYTIERNTPISLVCSNSIPSGQKLTNYDTTIIRTVDVLRINGKFSVVMLSYIDNRNASSLTVFNDSCHVVGSKYYSGARYVGSIQEWGGDVLVWTGQSGRTIINNVSDIIALIPVTYEKVKHQFCHGYGYGGNTYAYKTLAAAQARCTSDPKCSAIKQWYCDGVNRHSGGGDYGLCGPPGTGYGNYGHERCVYKKKLGGSGALNAPPGYVLAPASSCQSLDYMSDMCSYWACCYRRNRGWNNAWCRDRREGFCTNWCQLFHCSPKCPAGYLCANTNHCRRTSDKLCFKKARRRVQETQQPLEEIQQPLAAIAVAAHGQILADVYDKLNSTEPAGVAEIWQDLEGIDLNSEEMIELNIFADFHGVELGDTPQVRRRVEIEEKATTV